MRQKVLTRAAMLRLLVVLSLGWHKQPLVGVEVIGSSEPSTRLTTIKL